VLHSSSPARAQLGNDYDRRRFAINVNDPPITNTGLWPLSQPPPLPSLTLRHGNMEPAISLLRLVICQIPPHRLSFVLLLSVLLLLLTAYPLSIVTSSSFQPCRQYTQSLPPSAITASQRQHHCLSSSFHIASPTLLLNSPFRYHYIARGSVYLLASLLLLWRESLLLSLSTQCHLPFTLSSCDCLPHPTWETRPSFVTSFSHILTITPF